MASAPFEKRRIVVQFNKHSLISLNTGFAERAARFGSLANAPTVAALFLQGGAEKSDGSHCALQAAAIARTNGLR